MVSVIFVCDASWCTRRFVSCCVVPLRHTRGSPGRRPSTPPETTSWFANAAAAAEILQSIAVVAFLVGKECTHDALNRNIHQEDLHFEERKWIPRSSGYGQLGLKKTAMTFADSPGCQAFVERNRIDQLSIISTAQ
jgi:hypothetical protein